MEKERQVGELTEQDPKVKRGLGLDWSHMGVINKGRHDADVCTGNDFILGRIDFLR